MPIYDRNALYGVDGEPSVVAREPPTPAFVARAKSSSEAAALPNGEKALTPIIAGSISGAIIGVAWIVAVVYALVKRHRRKKRYKKAGRPELVHEQPRPDAFIVPPDPAVILGERKPGERVYVGKNKKKGQKELERKAREKLMNGEQASEAGVDKTIDEKQTPNREHAGDMRRELMDIPEDGQMNMPAPSRRPTNTSTSNSMALSIAIDDAEAHARRKRKLDKEKKEKDHIKEADFAFDEHSEDKHDASLSRHGHDGDDSRVNRP